VKVVNFILCIPSGFLSDFRFFVMYQLLPVNAAVVGRPDHYELRWNRDALLSTYMKNMLRERGCSEDIHFSTLNIYRLPG